MQPQFERLKAITLPFYAYGKNLLQIFVNIMTKNKMWKGFLVNFYGIFKLSGSGVL
jgi:hypothetical protein